MDDIRSLLASVDISSFIPTPAGYVAILRDRVEEGRRDDADAWVAEQGGSLRRTNPIRSQSLGRGRLTPQVVPGQDYYVVPRSALKA